MISRERFDYYSNALDQNAGMAVEELDDIFAEYLSAFTQDDLRAALSELMPALAEKYGSRAAAAAKEFYLEARSSLENAGEFEPVAQRADGESVRRASLAALEQSASMRALNSTLDGILVRHVNGAADETMVWNARSDPARTKWALVPSAGACGFCLLIASRGFDYATREKVARHNYCKCTVVVDFSDDPALEGYDLGEVQSLYKEAKASIDGEGLYDEWKEAKASNPKTGTYDNFKRNRLAAEMGRLKRAKDRVSNATTVHEAFCPTGEKTVLAEAARLDAGQSEAWRAFKGSDRSAASYARTYGAYVRSLSDGSIDVEDFAKLEGKELQVAKWFADSGDEVLIRNPNVHIKTDGNTSDAEINGELYDFKRVASPKSAKIRQRVLEHIDTQGPNFVVDVTTSDMGWDDAAGAVAELLDHKGVSKVILVQGGRAVLFEK